MSFVNRLQIRQHNLANAFVVAALAAFLVMLTTGAAASEPVILFTFSWALLLQLAISTVIPLLVGLVIKHTTNSAVKAISLALLSLISSLLTEILNSANAGTAYDLGQGLFIALPTFLIAVGMHYGLWKPVGATNAVQSVGERSAP